MHWTNAVAMLAAVLMPAAVVAQSSDGSSLGLPPDLAERAARRFPQPVRVGSLAGRKVLAPGENQPLLGHVATLVRGPDGAVRVVVRLAGWSATRAVAAPVEAFGLLGEHVVLLDLAPERLRALPTVQVAREAEIPPEETIRVGLTKPFH